VPTHLVTGAGSGIGAAVAGALLARGDELVLLARSSERAAALSQEYAGARTVVADLADPAGLADALAGRLPDRLDSLLHVAGVVELGAVSEVGAAAWRETVDVNLLAPAELTRLCLPALRATQGHVVFVNSGSGLRANPGWSAYAASKHGLKALADSLRAEEAGAGVRVTSVYPGRVATPMQEKVHEQEGKEYRPGDWVTSESVATAVLTALDLPRDAEMTDVTVRPEQLSPSSTIPLPRDYNNVLRDGVRWRMKMNESDIESARAFKTLFSEGLAKLNQQYHGAEEGGSGLRVKRLKATRQTTSAPEGG